MCVFYVYVYFGVYVCVDLHGFYYLFLFQITPAGKTLPSISMCFGLNIRYINNLINPEIHTHSHENKHIRN